MRRAKIQFALETALVRRALWLLRRLGPVAASNAGGAVARAVGPLLPVSRVADANLRRALPELDSAARRRVIRGVWDNLGRTASFGVVTGAASSVVASASTWRNSATENG
jgi:KDO2-lipid IV(A) lauroyltransferase